MNKLKSFVFSEQRLSKAIFGLLIIAALAFVFGPNVYAQFARHTGSTGWGYGYGYGYGYGGGFDGGTVAGYRTEGDVDPTVYEYEYGYGYIAAGVTYDATDGYTVTPSTMSSLVESGVMVPNGANPESTTVITFMEKVTLVPITGASIVIPAGTTMTASSSFAMSTLAAGTASVTDLTAIDSVGALSFGLPSLGLTVSPAITITIPVTVANGTVLDVYTKAPGGSWALLTTCTVASSACAFTTTHLSDFSAGDKCATVTNGSGGTYPSCTITCNSGYTLSGSTCVASSSGGSGGGVPPSAVMCTSVTYGDWTEACFGDYHFRPVLTRTPANCTITAAQQAATQKTCAVGAITVTIPGSTGITGIVTGAYQNMANFIALEKNLVKKINKALARRLAGRILLQVQEHGEAWYVNPLNDSKYYMGRPADAFALMRKLALGINNKDFNSYKNNTAPARLSGRILLKVEDDGRAYYVNPLNLKMHYLGRPADAFALMRSLGLGITNADLRQIEVRELD